MPAPTIVVASRNLKKTGELRELLKPLDVTVISVVDCPGVPEVEEDGSTFAENAAKKACQTARHVGHWTIGEDSGLEVAALRGAPGVYSARYSGPGATDASNNARLIRDLDGLPAERRGARYVCHIAVADPEGRLRCSLERYCRGRITTEPRGENGFGYDPYFLIPEYHRTFGELSPLVKCQLSHRARAMQALRPALQGLLAASP